MALYPGNEDVVKELHTEVEQLFGGVFDENLSCASLDFGGGAPRFVPGVTAADGTACLDVYYGDEYQYTLRKVAEMQTDDRCIDENGHIPLSDNVLLLYKALSKALERKKFRLTGKYSCANKYIKKDLSSTQFRNLPEVEADWPLPYVYTNTSPIQGKVNFKKKLPPPASTDQPTTPRRKVMIISVDTKRSLSGKIPEGKVVYLAGDHAEDAIVGTSNVTASTSAEKAETVCEELAPRNTKYASYGKRRHIDDSGYTHVVLSSPSSPSQNIHQRSRCGRYVAYAKMRSGHACVGMSDGQPDNGKEVSRIALDVVDLGGFGIGCEECRSLSDEYSNDEITELDKVFEGAWVLRGDRVTGHVDEDICPRDVVEKLRVGFVRIPSPSIRVRIIKMFRYMQKVSAAFKRHGANMFGFEQRDDGTIPCTIQKIAEHLRVEVDELLAFIVQNMSSGLFFRGTASFLVHKDRSESIFDITNALPVGPWMKGAVMDTGVGLLYIVSSGKYYSVETKDGVSWVTRYTGPTITEFKELSLAPLLAPSTVT